MKSWPWHTITLDVLAVHRPDGRSLLVTRFQQLSGWGAAAVEMATKDIGTHYFFDDHAHVVIVENKLSEDFVKQAAEKYARAWMKGGKNKKCDCGEIPATQTKRAAKKEALRVINEARILNQGRIRLGLVGDTTGKKIARRG